MAEAEGFEPSLPFSTNGLANRPLQPLGYTSMNGRQGQDRTVDLSVISTAL